MHVKSLPRRNGDTWSVRPYSGCQGYVIVAERKPYVECRELGVLAAEYVEIAAMRITLERFLNRQGQRVHAATHVGMACRDPYPHSRSDRDHRRRPSASTATAAVTALASTAPVIRIRAPVANSISIVPRSTAPAGAASGAIRTGANPIRGRTPNCRRQPYSWPG